MSTTSTELAQATAVLTGIKKAITACGTNHPVIKADLEAILSDAQDLVTELTPAPAPTPPVPTPPTPAPSLLVPVGIPGNWDAPDLNEEFSGTTLNTKLWTPGWFGATSSGPVNTLEIAAYSPSNVTVNDGLSLALTNDPITVKDKTFKWTGALISANPSDGVAGHTGFQYTYGVLEYKINVPAAANGEVANWPAAWADGQSWPTDGEDDVMEGLNGLFAFHFHDPAGGPGMTVANVKPGLHTFASDWQPGKVTYYYDGVEVGSITEGITDQPMYPILDYTSSGTPAAEAAVMQVEYVRVWSPAA